MGLLDLVDKYLGTPSGGGEDRGKAIAALQGISLPELKQLNPEMYKQIILERPELESTVNMQDSRMNNIQTDPRLKQAQMAALNQFMDITNNGGRDAQFQADASRLQNDVNSQLQGNTGAIQQNMAARGMSGGMGELVAKQLASQQAANRQSQMGLDLNAQAQQRALQALMNQGQLGGSMQQQSFNQQAAQAQAQDSINKFNAANSQQVQNNNVSRLNQTQLANWQNAQQGADKNTALQNDTAKFNTNGLTQQNFQNQVTKQTGVANQFNNNANGADNEQKNARQFAGGLFQAGANAAAKASTGGA